MTTRADTRLSAFSCLQLLAIAMVAAACGQSVDADNPAQSPSQTSSQEAGRAASGTTDALDRLIEEFVETRKADNQRGELRSVSAESFLEEIAADRRLLERIRAVPTDGLSSPERIDRKLMIGLLEADTYSAERRRIWEIDASLYVPAREVGVLLEPQSETASDQRSADLGKILDKIPGRLADGRDNLREPPRRFTEAALFRTTGTLESLRENGPGMVPQTAGAGEAFQQSLDAAITALEQYEQFLRDDLLPRSDGDWAIGKEHYDYILKHRWYLDADADEILARGRQAFADTEALAQEVSERIQPGKHWSEVYETLKDDHPAAEDIKAAYQQQIDAAQAFVIENRIVTLPAGEHVITVDTPPAMRRSSPFGTFQSVDQFGDGVEGKLVLTPIEDWMTPEQRAERLRSHHTAWIPIIAVHEAYPGHHVDALKTRENPRVLRKVVREPIFSEGWGLFTEEMMYETGFLEGDDVRLTQLRNRLWRAARVILDVSLHTGRMSFDEAVDFLADKVRFERYAAELEVGMYTARPTYVLGYLIGMQEIMNIREEYIERYGPPSPPSEFYDRLLSVGSLPPVLVREAIFDDASAGH